MPMEAFSLSTTTIPSSLTRRGATDKPSSHVNLSKHLHFMTFPSFTKHKILSIRAQASSSGSAKSSAGKAEGIPEKTDTKDDNLVFVAGATGKVGSRTVRELIKLGFRVRAGVRSAQRAGALVQSVKQLKIDATSGGSQAVEKLEIVECDLEKPDQIGSALGNASTVICSIGASEKEVFDITGPFRIDYQATKNLIDAATVAKVNHFILVTSLGTNKVGFPAAILNLFWGVLIWKRKAEEALLASGLPYTIVRPGGMERPTDAYKETHNITLSTEDALFGGQVSNLQIAELMAVMAKNRDLSYCKIVEVIAETTAPLTPMEKLLAKIPSQRPYVYSPKEPDVVAVNEPDPSANVVAPEPSIATEKETTQPKSVEKQPLSPYTAYDDLKPPSSPSPPQPSGWKQVEVNDTVPTTPSASDTPSTEPVLDGISQTTSFSEAKKYLSPYAVYEDLKPPTSPSPTPSSSNDKPLNASPEVESTGGNVAASTEVESTGGNVAASTEVESTGGNVAASTEVESTGGNVAASTEVESTEGNVAASTEVESTGANVAASTEVESTEGNVAASTEVESTGANVAASTTVESPASNVAEKNPSQDSNSFNSPYHVYSDFKPPTSPSPNAPNISLPKSAADAVPETVIVSSNGPAQLSIADEPIGAQDAPKPNDEQDAPKPNDEEDVPKPKSRPLSPYAMYEDLKPPTSPIPSFRKF